MACGVDDDEDVVFAALFKFLAKIACSPAPGKKNHACSKASWDTFTYDQDLSEAICQNI